MSGGMNALFDLQREMIKMQERQIDAAQAMLKAGSDAVKLQKSGQHALETAVEANKAWLQLWGIK